MVYSVVMATVVNALIEQSLYPLSENWLFLQNSILHKTAHWVKIRMLHERIVHTSFVFVRTEIKLKSIKPIHHWICLFMESKKIFGSCSHSKRHVSYGRLFAMR